MRISQATFLNATRRTIDELSAAAKDASVAVSSVYEEIGRTDKQWATQREVMLRAVAKLEHARKLITARIASLEAMAASAVTVEERIAIAD